MNDKVQEMHSKRTITMAMHMALDFDTQFPSESRKYAELVLALVPAAVQIVLADYYE
jgi:hypothetical protein